MATQKHYVTNLLDMRTLTIVFAVLIVGIVGYGFYAMTHGGIDNFQLDLNVKHQTAKPTIQSQNIPVQHLGQ